MSARKLARMVISDTEQITFIRHHCYREGKLKLVIPFLINITS